MQIFTRQEYWHQYVNEVVISTVITVNSRYLELSRDQQICLRHRELDLLSSHFVCIDKDGTDCFVRDIESSTRYRDSTVF